MRIIFLSLFVVLLAVERSSAEQYDKVSSLSFEEDAASDEEDVESFDEVVFMRFTKNQEPQMVQITNPLHIILVQRMADEQMVSRKLSKHHLATKVLKAVGKVAAKAICMTLIN